MREASPVMTDGRDTVEPGRPLRVLQVIDSLGVGGAETWLMALLRHWRSGADDIRVDFLATGGRADAFDEEALDLGARIFHLRYGVGRLPSFRRGFRAILRDGGYQAVHDHQDYASGWHYLLGAGLLPPVRVTHVHNPAYQIRNNYGTTLRRRLTARAGKGLVARYATHILGTSREVLARYGFDEAPFARTPAAALYCGFDPCRFRGDAAALGEVRAEFGWPAGAIVVLFAGRFDISADIDHPRNHKNSGFAVSVALEAVKRCENVRFIFAGAASPAVPVLRERIEAANAQQRVAIVGVRRDIGRLMTASNALLFPSREEGLGMVAVEAQAAGLPVLASTNVPRECVVIPEMVRFLDVADGAQAWTNALLSVARAPRADPARANRLVAASPFAVAHSAAALTRLYRGGALA
ncbi:MAG: glycosyltransferase [Caulobacteraceae bacterium]